MRFLVQSVSYCGVRRRGLSFRHGIGCRGGVKFGSALRAGGGREGRGTEVACSGVEITPPVASSLRRPSGWRGAGAHVDARIVDMRVGEPVMLGDEALHAPLGRLRHGDRYEVIDVYGELVHDLGEQQ